MSVTRGIPKEIRDAMKLRDSLAREMDRAEAQWRAAQFKLRRQIAMIDEMWRAHNAKTRRTS